MQIDKLTSPAAVKRRQTPCITFIDDSAIPGTQKGPLALCDNAGCSHGLSTWHV